MKDVRKIKLPFEHSNNAPDAMNLLFDEDESNTLYSHKKKPSVYKIGFIVVLILMLTASWVVFRMIMPKNHKNILTFSTKTDEAMIFSEHGINYDQIESWVDGAEKKELPVSQKENNQIAVMPDLPSPIIIPKAKISRAIKPVPTMSVSIAYKPTVPTKLSQTVKSSQIMSTVIQPKLKLSQTKKENTKIVKTGNNNKTPLKTITVTKPLITKSQSIKTIALTDDSVMLRPPIVVIEKPIQQTNELRRIKVD